MRRWLLILSAFIGVGAFWGAAMMFIDPTGAMWGMGPMLSIMQGQLPFADLFFKDFIWSGIALALINGVSNSVAWWALLKGKPNALKLQLACGVLLLMWLTVQWIIFEVNVLTTIYTFFAVIQILFSLMLRGYK